MNARQVLDKANVIELDLLKAINARLKTRTSRLQAIRNELHQIARTGRLNAREMLDMVCCLRACAGDDLREISASLLDVSCDLDGIVHYGADHE